MNAGQLLLALHENTDLVLAMAGAGLVAIGCWCLFGARRNPVQ